MCHYYVEWYFQHPPTKYRKIIVTQFKSPSNYTNTVASFQKGKIIDLFLFPFCWVKSFITKQYPCLPLDTEELQIQIVQKW